jgi:integrase
MWWYRTLIVAADVHDLHRVPSDPIKRIVCWRCCQKCSTWRKLGVIGPMDPTPVGTSKNTTSRRGAGAATVLNKDELRRLGVALDELEANSAHGVYAAAAIKLLLLTGARVNEVLQARWDWVDWDRNSIVLPDSKTGPKPLFLSNPALEVLRDLSARPEAATSAYIIKGRLRGKPLVNLTKPWKELCRAAELDDVRIHDLRHTAASVGVGHGLSLPIIGRLLGHSQPQTTNRYAHVDGDPALLAINTIGETIGLALGILSETHAVRPPRGER